MANKFALKFIIDGKDKGVIMALGNLHQFPVDFDKDRIPTKYAIIKTYRDGKLTAFYDSGRDVILADDLEVGKRCRLVTVDGGVSWIYDDQVNENIITAEQVYAERGKSAEVLETETLAKRPFISRILSRKS